MLMVDGQIGTDTEGAAKFLGKGVDWVEEMASKGLLPRKGKGWYIYQQLAEFALGLPDYQPRSRSGDVPATEPRDVPTLELKDATSEVRKDRQVGPVRGQRSKSYYREAAELLQQGESA